MPIVVDFPAPFGPEQPEHLPARDVEVDPLHRLDAAGVGLAQPAHLDRQSGSSCHIGPSCGSSPHDGSERKDVTVEDEDRQAREFEQHRAHLRAVAYRMLGSLSEAEDAVQESWFRLHRSDASRSKTCAAG